MGSNSLVPLLRMNNNGTIPVLGLGTWQSTGDVGKKAVKAALECGYRHIDTAMLYGNEAEVGEAVQEFLQETKTPRDQLFITTKLATPFLAADDVKPACQRSLKRLKVDRIDLYLVHSPIGFKNVGWDVAIPTDPDGNVLFEHHDLVACWKAMENLVDEGLVRAIGVSNLNSEQVSRILENCRIKPVTNQIECHAYFPQNNLIDFLQARGIFVTAYGPLGSPGRPAHMLQPGEDIPLMETEVVKELSKKYGKTPAQVLLRNLVQRGVVVIPMSTNPGRIRENSQIFDFELNLADMERIAGLDNGKRLFTYSHVWKDYHSEYPFSLPF